MGDGPEFPQNDSQSQWVSVIWENERQIQDQQSYLRAVVDMGR